MDAHSTEAAGRAVTARSLVTTMAAELAHCAQKLHHIQEDLAAVLPHLADSGAAVRIQNIDHVAQLVESLAGVAEGLTATLGDDTAIGPEIVAERKVLREVLDKIWREEEVGGPSGDHGSGDLHLL